MIEITTKNFAGNIILHEKEDILKMATKTGTMRKRGDTLEYWDMFYAVLSGSYLYFYKEDSEENDSYDSWIYLKDTVVVFNEDNDEEDSENVFVISNRDTTLHLFVSDQQELKDWIKCIRERVYEIGSINDSFQSQDPVSEKGKRRASSLDIQYNIPEITIFRANLHFDKFEFNLVHDDYSKFLNFKITEMALVSNTVTLGEFSNIDGLPKSVNNKYSNIIEMNLAKLQIYDRKNDMVALETKNPLSMSINILDKSSKKYKGDKVVIGLKVDIAVFNFIPDSIKYMVNFLKRTEYEGGNAVLVDSNLKPKHEHRIEASLKSTIKMKITKSKRRLSLESLDGGELSSQRTVNDEDLVTLGTKNVLKVNISINTVGMTMINPYNMKPFVYMDIKAFGVTYELYQIHHQLQIKAKDVTISADSPIFNTFKVANIDPEWLRNHRGEKDFAFNFDMKIFKEEFMSSNQKISNILRIDFGGL